MKTPQVTLENACPEFEADLVLYYYGDGADAERRRVEGHVKSCERCGRFLADLRGLLPAMAKPQVFPQSFWDGYYREMVQKLDQERERKSWWRGLLPVFGGWMVPAFGTAAMAILAVVLVFGKGDWSQNSNPTNAETLPQEVLTDARRIEFFNSMDLLESLGTLEKMDGGASPAREVRSL